MTPGQGRQGQQEVEQLHGAGHKLVQSTAAGGRGGGGGVLPFIGDIEVLEGGGGETSLLRKGISLYDLAC